MDDLRRQREQLEEKLQHAHEAFDVEYRSIATVWGVAFGHLQIERRLNPELITILYVLFNAACFAVGVAFTLLGGILRTLGISLVVGGLFSFGAFMAQWWDHAWQRTNNTFDRAFNSGYDDKRYAELQRLAKEYWELYEELKGLPKLSS